MHFLVQQNYLDDAKITLLVVHYETKEPVITIFYVFFFVFDYLLLVDEFQFYYPRTLL